jgi:hypothetical protein
MQANEQRNPKWMTWTGWIIGGLPALMLIMGGITNLMKPEFAVKGSADLGFDESLIIPLGITLLACALIYLIPQTAVLGAILLTGYFGGAVAAHVRNFEPFIVAVVFAALIWVGLWLRDPRLRAIAPIRTTL